MKKLSSKQDLEYFCPTKEEDSVLERLNPEYKTISEMSVEERQFLNGLILRNKPRKILELGVAAGGSSIIILNAIKDTDAELFSVDYSKAYYNDKSLNTGFCVDNYPELKVKWSLYTGGLAGKYMDEIKDGIDFCLIDTVHSNPGEILDFLMVLPYLTEDAIVVFHDTNLHMWTANSFESFITNNLLMSAISGNKIVQGNYKYNCKTNHMPNIAAIKLGENTRKHLFEIFNLLTLKWKYMLNEEDEKVFKSSVERFYPEEYSQYIDRIFTYHKNILEKPSLASKEKYKPKKLSFFEKIFSLRNENDHKILRVLGIVFRFKKAGQCESKRNI